MQNARGMIRPRKPNVLVAGFPKCGSTFLYHLLKQHPDIFIPKIKELNYFNKDHFFISDPEILNPRYFKPFSWYLGFFKTDRKIVMDFSILSALDIASPKRVKERLGDIKIIFITRNQKDFIRSMRNFISKEAGDPEKAHSYSDFDFYIRNYRQYFTKVHVIKLEEIDKEPQKTLDKVTKFLGIKKHRFETSRPRHRTEDYKMPPLQMARRRVYFTIVKSFYKFLPWTVRAKIKAQGED